MPENGEENAIDISRVERDEGEEGQPPVKFTLAPSDDVSRLVSSISAARKAMSSEERRDLDARLRDLIENGDDDDAQSFGERTGAFI